MAATGAGVGVAEGAASAGAAVVASTTAVAAAAARASAAAAAAAAVVLGLVCEALVTSTQGNSLVSPVGDLFLDLRLDDDGRVDLLGDRGRDRRCVLVELVVVELLAEELLADGLEVASALGRAALSMLVLEQLVASLEAARPVATGRELSDDDGRHALGLTERVRRVAAHRLLHQGVALAEGVDDVFLRGARVGVAADLFASPEASEQEKDEDAERLVFGLDDTQEFRFEQEVRVEIHREERIK